MCAQKKECVVRFIRGLALASLLCVGLLVPRSSWSAQAAGTTALDADRWLEIDLYWFRQQEIKASKEQLTKLKEKSKGSSQAQVDQVLSEINSIEKGTPEAMGLTAAGTGLQSVLRVVEGGARATPQQALEVYRISSEAAKTRIAEWEKLKGGKPAELEKSHAN